MQYRNINTYQNQLLGRIAGTQHHAWGIRNPSNQKSVFMKPMEFNEWLLAGMNFYHEKHGFIFTVLASGLMRIERPGKPNLLRTIQDYKREHKQYEEEYYL
jgi:hypothetical protein